MGEKLGDGWWSCMRGWCIVSGCVGCDWNFFYGLVLCVGIFFSILFSVCAVLDSPLTCPSVFGCVYMYPRPCLYFLKQFSEFFLQKDSRLGMYFAFFSVNIAPNPILIEDS